MPTTLANSMPAANTPSVSDAASPRQYWRPPALMKRYQIAKLVGTAFFVLIFAGWLWLQWSNPMMRIVAGGLLFMTVWFTFKSVAVDNLRARKGHLAIIDNKLEITRNLGAETATLLIPLNNIGHAEWRNDTDETAGLHLFSHTGSSMSFLNLDFVADEAEARSLANWIRSTTNQAFEVRWPQPTT